MCCASCSVRATRDCLLSLRACLVCVIEFLVGFLLPFMRNTCVSDWFGHRATRLFYLLSRIRISSCYRTFFRGRIWEFWRVFVTIGWFHPLFSIFISKNLVDHFTKCFTESDSQERARAARSSLRDNRIPVSIDGPVWFVEMILWFICFLWRGIETLPVGRSFCKTNFMIRANDWPASKKTNIDKTSQTWSRWQMS